MTKHFRERIGHKKFKYQFNGLVKLLMILGKLSPILFGLYVRC